MLKKLLKYEFMATGRSFGALYLGLFGVAALIGLLFRFGVGAPAVSEQNIDTLPRFLATAVVVLMALYMILLVSAGVMTLVTIITRFTKNLLGGEGYLMHTLPVSPQTLIISKTIAGGVWTIASGLAVLLSMAILLLVGVAGMTGYSAAWSEIQQGIAEMERQVGVSLPVLLLGALVAGAAMMLNGILCIYASVMVGHQFKKHAVPAAILAFLVLANLESLLISLTGIGGACAVRASGAAQSFEAALSAMPTAAQLGTMWLGAVVPSVVFGAVFFCVTERLMEKRLNLE